MEKELKEKQLKWLEMVKNSNNGQIPKGWDNEFFLNAVFKIFSYVKENCSQTKINAGKVRDHNDFSHQHMEYTPIQILTNRLLKNVKSFEIVDTDPSTRQMGGYYNILKKICISNNVLTDNINRNKASFIENFKDEKQYFETFYGKTVIHEILHALSDNDKYVGFEDKKSGVGKAFNEGYTELLASIIAGTFQYLKTNEVEFNGANINITSQTDGGYVLEQNIVNLVKISSSNMVLPYLVDTRYYNFTKEKDVEKLKEIYGTEKPFEFIFAQLDKINLNRDKQKTLKNEDEKKKLKQENINIMFDLQDKLIQDIFAFKFANFTDKIRNGYNPTKEEVLELEENIKFVGKILMFENLEQNKDFDLTNVNDIRECVKNGKIKNSNNIKSYLQVLIAINGLKNDLNMTI